MAELSSTALTYIVCQPSIRFKTSQRCSTAKHQFLKAKHQKWLDRFFCINRDNAASLQRYTCTQFYILYTGCYLLWVRFSHQKSIIMHVRMKFARTCQYTLPWYSRQELSHDILYDRRCHSAVLHSWLVSCVIGNIAHTHLSLRENGSINACQTRLANFL